MRALLARIVFSGCVGWFYPWISCGYPFINRSGVREKRMAKLTQRELACLKLLSKGLRAAAIAEEFSISVKTVDKHIAAAKLKLGAKTREHALTIAISQKLIEID